MFVDTAALEIACEQVLHAGSINVDISPIIFASDTSRGSLPKSNLNAIMKNNAKACTILTKLEERIATMKYDLRLRVNNLHTAMAPVSSLPTELLCDIFHIVHRASPSSKSSVALSHVCGRWRSIALELPELWTFVDISSSRAKEMLAEFARRSRDAALCLSTESPFSVKDHSLLVEQPLAHRVHTINLTLPDLDRAMFSSILKWPFDHSPILETLVIVSNGPYHPILDIRGMPPAQKLEIQGVTLVCDDVATPLHGEVKHLHLCALLATAYGSTILALQPINLQTLWLERICEWDDHDGSRMQLFLDATRPFSPISLCFTECTPQVWLSTLQMCVPERLETLVLEYSPSWNRSRPRDMPRGANDILRAFMARARNLKHLTLNLSADLMYTFLSIFSETDSEGERPFPNLTHLEVRVTDWPECLRLPHLRHLLPETFRFLIHDRCIASRVGAVKRLESLVVNRRPMEPASVSREDGIIPAHLLADH